MAYDYKLLRVEIENRIAWVTVDAPPINVITGPLYAELSALSKELKADPNLSVVVLKSADPDFLLAHFDVGLILQFPTHEPAQRDPELNDYHAMCERFRTMDKVTIAQIEGRVGGGGSELVSSFDMRFGVRGKTKINQMEVPLGILPGGTGTQRLPRLVGRGRAIEIILGADDLDVGDGGAVGLSEPNIRGERNRPLRGGVGATHCDISGGSRAPRQREHQQRREAAFRIAARRSVPVPAHASHAKARNATCGVSSRWAGRRAKAN